MNNHLSNICSPYSNSLKKNPIRYFLWPSNSGRFSWSVPNRLKSLASQKRSPLLPEVTEPSAIYLRSPLSIRPGFQELIKTIKMVLKFKIGWTLSNSFTSINYSSVNTFDIPDSKSVKSSRPISCHKNWFQPATDQYLKLSILYFFFLALIKKYGETYRKPRIRLIYAWLRNAKVSLYNELNIWKPKKILLWLLL